MNQADAQVARIITRFSAAIACVVALSLPLGFALTALRDLESALDFKARVKASALSSLIASNPDVWMYAENRIQGLIAREPVPLESEWLRVRDAAGADILTSGTPPTAPFMTRGYPLYDAGQVAGRLEVSVSLHELIASALLAGLAGIALGAGVFLFIRGVPLRALQRTMQALAEEKQRAVTTLASINDAVLVADDTGRLLRANPAAQGLIAASGSGPAIGRPVADCIDAANRDVFAALHARVIAGEEGYLLFRAAGRRWFEMRSVRMVEDGKPLHLAVVRDITERKEAEEALKEYQNRLEELVAARTADLRAAHEKLSDTLFAMDKVGIGIHWADAETGRFIYANRCAAETLGYTVEELLELGVSDIDRNFPPPAFREISTRIRAEGHLQFETTQQKKNGRGVPVEITVYYQPGGDQARPRLISFMTDITRRKEAELALIQAKEAAEAANVAKSAFLANMSHEIRTPLNAVLGMAYLVRHEGVTPHQAEQLVTIETAGRQLLHIINDVLDLSNIEAGKMVLEEAAVDLGRIAANVVGTLRAHAEAKQLALRCDAEPQAFPMTGDPGRLQQALMNIVANAVKFTETGAIDLRVRFEQESESSVLVRFEVRDTGIGIATDNLERIFSVFEQADNSSTRQFGGTGLGLAITKRLAMLMGGDVGVSSLPGVGSTFWFTARLKKGQPQQAGAPRSPADLAWSALAVD